MHKLYLKLLYYNAFIFILLTGFYYIPDTIIDGTLLISGFKNTINFTQAKRIAYCLLLILLFFKIDWFKIKFDLFLIACLCWLIGHLLTYIFDQSNTGLYIERIFQLIFVFGFVTFFRQQEIINIQEMFLSIPKKVLFFLFVILIILTYLSYEWAYGLYTGFGGRRVNFSIWLSQIIFMVLMIPLFKKNYYSKQFSINFFKLLVLISPIFILQLLGAGRTGLLVSIIIITAFTWFYTRNFKILFLTFIYFFSLSIIFNKYTSISVHHEKFDASTIEFVKTFRNITPDYAKKQQQPDLIQSNPVLEYFDHLSSRRLLLFIYGIDLVKDMNPFIGLGIQKNLLHDIDGYIGGHGRRVHNMFLNHYSEIGIFGLISLLIIYFQLFINYKNYNKKGKLLVINFIIFGIVSTLQPVYLFSQVSTCLVPWFIYGLLLSKMFKKRSIHS